MRKGLIILFLLLVFAFGIIGLQQENDEQSGQREKTSLVLEK